jgi:hypothetical protein
MVNPLSYLEKIENLIAINLYVVSLQKVLNYETLP